MRPSQEPHAHEAPGVVRRPCRAVFTAGVVEQPWSRVCVPRRFDGLSVDVVPAARDTTDSQNWGRAVALTSAHSFAEVSRRGACRPRQLRFAILGLAEHSRSNEGSKHVESYPQWLTKKRASGALAGKQCPPSRTDTCPDSNTMCSPPWMASPEQLASWIGGVDIVPDEAPWHPGGRIEGQRLIVVR